MFMKSFVVEGVALGTAGEKVTYLSVDPSRQGAEIAHKAGVAEVVKSDTDVDGAAP